MWFDSCGCCPLGVFNLHRQRNIGWYLLYCIGWIGLKLSGCNYCYSNKYLLHEVVYVLVVVVFVR
jgi:hypothetical protein